MLWDFLLENNSIDAELLEFFDYEGWHNTVHKN